MAHPVSQLLRLAAASLAIAIVSTPTTALAAKRARPIVLFTHPGAPHWIAPSGVPPLALARTPPAAPPHDWREDTASKQSLSLEDQGCSAGACTTEEMGRTLNRLLAEPHATRSQSRRPGTRVAAFGLSLTWPIHLTRSVAVGTANAGAYGTTVTVTKKF